MFVSEHIGLSMVKRYILLGQRLKQLKQNKENGKGF